MDDSHPLVRELESGLADAAAALNSADVSASGALGTPVSLIQDTLEFQVRPEAPDADTTTSWLSVDDFLKYTPFFADYGPPNLGKVVRFCEMVDSELTAAATAGTKVVIWCSDHPHRRTNAAVLAGAYLVIRCGFTGEEAYTAFVGMQPPPLPLRDAAFGLCTFTLTLLDCLEGLEVARRHRLFSWDAFDVAAYEHDEQLGNGDLNWIVPGLFVAFSGPLDAVKRLSDGRTTWHPRKYREYFRTNGVVAVVRLNKACYDKGTLTRAGIQHYDLFYPDGGLAPPEILGRFLRIAETSRGAIGVHCKAGLGRTGTCIGAYLMKHYRMTGRESIAWMRICRPGSVLGPQQQYLEKLQPQMWRLGKESGLPAHTGTVPYPPPSSSSPACARRARPHHAIIIQTAPSTPTGSAPSSAASSSARGSFDAEGADAGPLIGVVAAQELLRAAPPHSTAEGAMMPDASGDGTPSVSWSAAMIAGAAAADAAMLPAGRSGSEMESPTRSRDGSPHDPATPTGSDSTVHTPGHGRAMMPFAIRANRRLDGQQLGAPTPSAASTAQGVAVDSLSSPGGSKKLLPHLVPRDGDTTSTAAAAASVSGAGGHE